MKILALTVSMGMLLCALMFKNENCGIVYAVLSVGAAIEYRIMNLRGCDD